MGDINLAFLNLRFIDNELVMTSWEFDRVDELHTTGSQILATRPASRSFTAGDYGRVPFHIARRETEEERRVAHLVYSNEWRCAQRPLYGVDLRQCLSIPTPSVLSPHARSRFGPHSPFMRSVTKSLVLPGHSSFRTSNARHRSMIC